MLDLFGSRFLESGFDPLHDRPGLVLAEQREDQGDQREAQQQVGIFADRPRGRFRDGVPAAWSWSATKAGAGRHRPASWPGWASIPAVPSRTARDRPVCPERSGSGIGWDRNASALNVLTTSGLGIFSTASQCGHFVLRPASESAAFKVLPQVQVNRIGIDRVLRRSRRRVAPRVEAPDLATRPTEGLQSADLRFRSRRGRETRAEQWSLPRRGRETRRTIAPGGVGRPAPNNRPAGSGDPRRTIAQAGSGDPAEQAVPSYGSVAFPGRVNSPHGREKDSRRE